MCIKLIAIDMDGSMLNSKSEMPKKNLETIKKAAENDILIVPTTGRTISELKPLKNTEYFDYAICANGACVWNLKNKKIISYNLISINEITKVFDVLSSYELLLEVYINGEIYVEKQNYYNPEKFGIYPEHIKLFKESRTPVENLYEFILKTNLKSEKMNIIPKSQSVYGELWDNLNHLKNICITTSGFGEIEVNNKSANKANGLASLASYLNIPKENIMAIGDSLNDIEMLKWAGVSVAMGNAKKEIKNIAKFSTLTNNDNGVALAIERFALNK